MKRCEKFWHLLSEQLGNIWSTFKEDFNESLKWLQNLTMGALSKERATEFASLE